jgi:asparagine synthase (glutamine-hydrolysing)
MYRSPSHFMSGILQRYHLAARCEAWYNLGQEKGVEYRYPMIDRRIIEYCFQLDATLFAGEKLNKPLIRAIAAEYLPEEVVSGEQLLDPVLFQNLNAAQEAATASLREALPEMKQNPTLRFFRFDRLEEALLHLDADGLPDENTRYVLTYLAAAHAVTRGLNSPTS